MLSWANLARYQQHLQTLVNLDSGSHDRAGLLRVSDEVASWYLSLGWQVKRHDLGEHTGVLLEITNRPADRYAVTLVGHLDTVFPTGTAAARPFCIRDGMAYGPGVGDMKNGIAAMYEVVAGLAPAVLDAVPIRLVCNPDEEIGSPYSRALMQTFGAQSEYVFVLESQEDDGTHCFARNGRLFYRLRLHGKAAHAGFQFERPCASAVRALAHYIAAFYALENQQACTTVNVGMVQSTQPVNVVADLAEFEVELRFRTEDERQRLCAAIDALLYGAPLVEGVTVEVVQSSNTPAWTRDARSEALIATLRTLAQKRGQDFLERDRCGLSDANWLAQGGAVVADGMGPHGAFDHSERECSRLHSIMPCTALLCDFITHLAHSNA